MWKPFAPVSTEKLLYEYYLPLKNNKPMFDDVIESSDEYLIIYAKYYIIKSDILKSIRNLFFFKY